MWFWFLFLWWLMILNIFTCAYLTFVYSSLGYILSIIRLGCLSSHRTVLRILLFVLALRKLICSSGWSWALKNFPSSFRVLGTIGMDHHACLWEVWMLVCCLEQDLHFFLSVYLIFLPSWHCLPKALALSLMTSNLFSVYLTEDKFVIKSRKSIALVQILNF